MDGEDHLNHRVRNEVVHTVDEEGHIIHKTKRRNTEGKIEVMVKRGKDLSNYWMTIRKREATGN